MQGRFREKPERKFFWLEIFPVAGNPDDRLFTKKVPKIFLHGRISPGIIPDTGHGREIYKTKISAGHD